MSATTYDLTSGLDGKQTNAPKAQMNVPGTVLMKVRVSIPEWIAKKAVAAFVGSSSDVLEIMDIPAGTFVHAVWTKIVTPEGATLGGTVGDATQAAGFMAAVTGNAAAGTYQGPAGSEAYAAYGGKFYAAADTLDWTLATEATVTTAVIDFFVLATFSA
jgi:hypothetical protein